MQMPILQARYVEMFIIIASNKSLTNVLFFRTFPPPNVCMRFSVGRASLRTKGTMINFHLKVTQNFIMQNTLLKVTYYTECH